MLFTICYLYVIEEFKWEKFGGLGLVSVCVYAIVSV